MTRLPRLQWAFPQVFGLAMLLVVVLAKATVVAQVAPQRALDFQGTSGPVLGPTASGPTPFGPTLGPVHQGPVLHAGVSPLGVCYNAAGAVFGVPTLYVADLYDGLTYLYNANNLTLLGSIPNPAGVTATTGIATNGTLLYWVADNNLYTSAMNGTAFTTIGPLALPQPGAVCGDICRDALGRLWAVDIANDFISAHSATTGAYLSLGFNHPGGVEAFGNGIAFRSDCGRFEIPFGVELSGQVTDVAVTTDTGFVLGTVSVGGLGAFVNGVESAIPSPGFGGPSLFVVENATNALFEIPAANPCPAPQPDCHVSPGVGYSLTFDDFPTSTFSATPALPITAVLPTTNSTITVAGLASMVQNVSCAIDASHTWIGDLDVTLTHVASGVRVHLHDSAGLATDDLLATFADDGRPYGAPFAAGDRMRASGGALSSTPPGDFGDFTGLAADGAWRLAVTDNFAGEDGTLNAWGLTFTSTLAIPDGVAGGVVLAIDASASIYDGVGDLDVLLEIEHTAPQQLAIELTSPTGTVLMLKNAGAAIAGGVLPVRFDDNPGLGGFNDGFGTAFPAGPGTLATFDGTPVAGTWLLRITDPTTGTAGRVRRAELLVCASACGAPTNLNCVSNCSSQNVALTWTNAQSYASVEVRRNGVSIATLPGTATSYNQSAPAGTYTYEIVGHCTSGAAATDCTIVHAPYALERNVIFAGEAPFGDVDSVAALYAALVAASEPVIITDTLDYPCLAQLPANGALWACLGTFPANYVLSTMDGQTLADLAADGVPIYLEGGDVWGFDNATAFAARDGVENGTADDGDDSFVAMVGLNHGALLLAGFAATYDHDQAGDDYTDRLLPTGATGGVPLDVAGSGAGAVWRDSAQSYNTAIHYTPTGGSGRVIAQSWEFGGYGGNQTQLAAAYRAALFGAITGDAFQRGNINTNLGTDVSDVVYLLNYLFVPLSPNLPCFDAADTNDSGLVDISDAVYLLNYLFVPGSPPPPAPGPTTCGVDPTSDAQECASFPSC